MTNATTESMKEDDDALRLSSVANVEGASGKVVFVTETMIVVTIASNDVYKRCLEEKTLPQAKCHEPSLLFTSLTNLYYELTSTHVFKK